MDDPPAFPSLIPVTKGNRETGVRLPVAPPVGLLKVRRKLRTPARKEKEAELETNFGFHRPK